MTTTGPDPVLARLLGAAAVARERVGLDVLAKVLDLDADDCLAAVDRAVATDVLVFDAESGETWFADEAARRKVDQGLALADRADLHRRYAAVLASEQGVGRGTVARHLRATLAATLDPEDRARLQVRLAAQAVRDGDLETARAAARAGIEAARRTGSTALLAEAASALEPVGDSAWDGDVHQWCAEALAAPSLPDVERVRLLTRQTQAAVYCGRTEEALAASEDALRRADELGDTDLVVEALTARQLATSGPDDVEELDRLAGRMVGIGTAAGRAEVEMWGRLWRIDARWYVGDLGAIEAEVARLASCVGRIEGPYAHWHLLVTRASLALARADFAAADRLQEQAVALFRAIGHPAARGASLAFRLWLGHARGHAEELLAAETWEIGTEARWVLFAPLARALALVDAGRSEEAAAVYQRCGAPQRWQVPRLGALLVWAIAARVAAGVGAEDDVRHLRGRLEPHRGRYVVGGGGGTNFLGPVELTLGLCAAALDEWDAADEDLRRAAALCREVGAPGLRVEAACLRAETLLRSGDQAAAAALADEVVPLAHTLGMAPWVGRLERMTGTGDPLSPREREVAALVADGLSNREIAARLVISERTAQNHVQHILGKLSFANRAQIAAWAARTHPR